MQRAKKKHQRQKNERPPCITQIAMGKKTNEERSRTFGKQEA